MPIVDTGTDVFVRGKFCTKELLHAVHDATVVDDLLEIVTIHL